MVETFSGQQSIASSSQLRDQIWKELRQVDPDFFCPNYCRKVQKDRLPRLVTSETLGALLHRGNYYAAWNPEYPHLGLTGAGLLACFGSPQEDQDRILIQLKIQDENWKRLQEADPEMFTSNYFQAISRDRHPHIVEDGTVGALLHRGHYYGVLHKKYRYVRLDENGRIICCDRPRIPTSPKEVREVLELISGDKSSPRSDTFLMTELKQIAKNLRLPSYESKEALALSIRNYVIGMN